MATRAVEEIAQAVGKLDKIDGFLKYKPQGGVTESRQIRRLVQTGHEDDRQIGADGAQFPGQIGTEQARHRVVGNDQIELIRIGAERVLGLHAVRPGDDAVSQFAQLLLHHAENRNFVVHHEDVSAAGGGARLATRG